MSTAENLTPTPDEAGWTPDPKVSEVERARKEDPDFPEALARAIAKGRGERYDPKRHGPFDPKLPPRQERKQKMEKPEAGNLDVKLEEIIGRFRERGPRLRLIPNAERESVRKVRDQ